MSLNKTEKILCVLNYASHYRESIYLGMESQLNCYFAFGTSGVGRIKKMDYSLFKRKVHELSTLKLLGNFHWIKGSVSLALKDFDKIVLTGTPYCVSNWVILILALLLKKKVYLWTHGYYGNEKGIRKKLKNIFFSFSYMLFLYGNRSKELMVDDGFDEGKLCVIYNSLNYDEQLQYRLKAKECAVFHSFFSSSYPVIIFVGRLTLIKNLSLLIRAISILKDKGFLINIFFIGDGPERATLQELTDFLNLSRNIFFYGSLYNEKLLSKFIYNADLCVSPGNVGLTAIHSLMYGTPVITHDKFECQMPEVESIIPNVTGNFFEYNNADSLALVIMNWFFEKTDRLRVRNDCYKVIDQFYNPKYQIEKLKRILL